MVGALSGAGKRVGGRGAPGVAHEAAACASVLTAVTELLASTTAALDRIADSRQSNPYRDRIAISPAEVAEALGVDRSTVYRLLEKAQRGDPGGLPASRVGGRLLVRTSALEAFLIEHEIGAGDGAQWGAA